MADLLPQQRLLLELIMMSGDVTVPKKDDGSMLYRTLKECQKLRWVSVVPAGEDAELATVTHLGRKAV